MGRDQQQAVLARNPLFLRETELERTLELLLLAQCQIGRGEPASGATMLADLDIKILYLVGRRPEIAMAELINLLGTNKQSLSRHVRALIAGGLLEQASGTSDRRRRPLRVTEAGAQRLGEVDAIDKRRLRRAFINAGPEAVEGFQRVLHELINLPARRHPARRAA
jgi:DNA-binding MarR family transcriptional regulator